MRKPRLGFLGLGWIGQCRLRSVVAARVAEVVAFVEPMEENTARALEIAPCARSLHSIEDLLKEDLDGVVIATPSALHAEQTMLALEHGLAVFCQKPLGRDAEEVRRMITAARERNRLLGVDLSYRHTTALRRIRELVQDGSIGDVFAVELAFHNAYGPQAPWFYNPALSGGGCVTDLGIHLVDAALWILDVPLVGIHGRVFAGGRPLSASRDEVEDFAIARLDFANGAIAQMACSWRLHAGQDAIIRLEFFGTRGAAVMRNVDGSFVDFRAERFTGTSRQVIAEPPDDWGGRAIAAWARQLAETCAFDPEIERQVDVAEALDGIYARDAAGNIVSTP